MVRKNGSITVFLSLVGILIFALIGTLLETARYTVCQNYVKRISQVAAEGLMTEYSRPLYENYGLFFIEESGTPFEQVIGRYAGDMLEGEGKGVTNFLSGHFTGTMVKNKTYVGDYEALPLQKEITDYMGRVVTKETLEKWTEKSSQLKKVEDDAKKLEEQVETEKNEAKLDEKLLQLMKLVDGISVYDGKIYCASEFVKMFAVCEKKGQNFGITEGRVWEKMEKQLDTTPKNWDTVRKTAVLNRVRRVKELCQKAIDVGNSLQKEYAGISGAENSHSMVALVVQGLPSLKTNLGILEETERILQKNSIKESKEELLALWQEYDTHSLVFDYSGITEQGGGENPKDSLSSSWKKGILNLVRPDSVSISKKSIQHADSYSILYENQEEKEEYGTRVSDFTERDTVSFQGTLGKVGKYTMDEFCLNTYITKYFGSCVKKMSTKWKHSLDYGLEYVAVGGDSDEENLASILNRILLIRSVVNFGTIYKDTSKKAQAKTAALAVVGFTGLQPLVTLTQTLILITWSIVESLVDIAGLLMEKHVPVLKKKSDITTSFSQIFQIDRKRITHRAAQLKGKKKTSFTYSDYVFLFLAMTKQKTRRYRIMDLIEQDMQENGYDTFRLGKCVHDMEVKANASFSNLFFQMPVVEKMLGRKWRMYTVTSEITVSY